MQPVADLVINPQRAYAADAPQNVELINVRESPIDVQVNKNMNDNLSLREKGVNPVLTRPVADLVVNP